MDEGHPLELDFLLHQLPEVVVEQRPSQKKQWQVEEGVKTEIRLELRKQ